MTTRQQVWLQAYCAAIRAKSRLPLAVADDALEYFDRRFPEPCPTTTADAVAKWLNLPSSNY